MGSIDQLPKPTKSNTTQAWDTLSQILPSRDADKDYWWKLTGLQLAFMLDEAGYTLAEQYEALLFHYHWTTPYFGPGPGPKGPAVWASLLGPDGSPIEYSWKWNEKVSGHPAIRYSIEPISRAAGTTLDPLNQLAASEMLHRLAVQVPGVNLQWTEHFLATLFDHDKAKYAQEAAAGAHYTTTFMLAAEFNPSAPMSFKSYFIPRKLGQGKGLIPLPLWKNSLVQLQPENTARDLVYDFIETSPEGPKMVPMILAVDNVPIAKSRLKFYLQTSSTSFASAREIMTVGGRVPLTESQLGDLRSLISAVVGDFPEDEHVPRTRNYSPAAQDNFVEIPELLAGYIYYFDMAPTSKTPDVKLYIPTRHIGPDDLTIARGLVGWLENHGRGGYGQNYMKMLLSLAEHRRLDAGKGLQTYIGIMFKKDGKLDITSYLGAEAFDPARMRGAGANMEEANHRRRTAVGFGEF
ncbi:dimethylallyl tryptophan synthase GliD1 [Nemania sp. NC0429]|nr:dimethylallyl tryptophan synthase GliD1 [Nemania sp. NC0429]